MAVEQEKLQILVLMDLVVEVEQLIFELVALYWQIELWLQPEVEEWEEEPRMLQEEEEDVLQVQLGLTLLVEVVPVVPKHPVVQEELLGDQDRMELLVLWVMVELEQLIIATIILLVEEVEVGILAEVAVVPIVSQVLLTAVEEEEEDLP